MTVSKNKQRLMVSLTKKQVELLNDLAREKGFSKSAIIALALEEYMKGEK
ncbi:TPA: CopG family transcriptional regulator [Staphylococcus aureus]